MDLNRFDTPRYLSVLPLFGDCRPAHLQQLAEDSQLRRYGRAEPVFRCGDPCDALHVVVTGQVKLHAISATGQEKVIRLVGAGYSFGEALVFGQQPCAVNATALSDTLVLTLRKAALLAEVARDPHLALRLLAGMSEQVHGLMSDVEAYALHSGTQRVVNYLLQERKPAGDSGSLVSLPVSKATIASRLSITPEYFSRVLSELEAGGMISVRRRDIHVLDARRLARHGLQ